MKDGKLQLRGLQYRIGFLLIVVEQSIESTKDQFAKWVHRRRQGLHTAGQFLHCMVKP